MGSHPVDDVPPHESAGEPHQKRRNRWMWACAGLAIVAAGLAVWGASRQAALDDSEQQVAQLESNADQARSGGSAVVAGFKGAYDALTAQLGATNEDLEATQQDLAADDEAADKAAKDAASAKEDAAEAKDETAKATAQAETERAQSKATIVKDCAKAYVSALGALSDADSVSAGASAVKQDLQSISDECANALAGA